MIYSFGVYRLDTQHLTLDRYGQPVEIHPKALQVLAYLVSNRDRAVPFHELFEEFWPATFLVDTSLRSAIRVLRQTLSEGSGADEPIQPVYRHSYRFIPEVREGDALAGFDSTRQDEF